jgi:hypothetical protein
LLIASQRAFTRPPQRDERAVQALGPIARARRATGQLAHGLRHARADLRGGRNERWRRLREERNEIGRAQFQGSLGAQPEVEARPGSGVRQEPERGPQPFTELLEFERSGEGRETRQRMAHHRTIAEGPSPFDAHEHARRLGLVRPQPSAGIDRLRDQACQLLARVSGAGKDHQQSDGGLGIESLRAPASDPLELVGSVVGDHELAADACGSLVATQNLCFPAATPAGLDDGPQPRAHFTETGERHLAFATDRAELRCHSLSARGAESSLMLRDDATHRDERGLLPACGCGDTYVDRVLERQRIRPPQGIGERDIGGE